MTVFILKILAMCSMLSDHIAVSFVSTDHLLMRKIIGRLAFIIYAFLISESYCHLREKPQRLRSHVGKLLILGAVSEFLYDMFAHRQWISFETQNVIWTLLFGFAALIVTGYIGKKVRNKAAALAINAAVCLAAAVSAHCIKSDYGLSGVLLIVMFCAYLCRADAMNWLRRLGCLALIEAIFCSLYAWESVGFGGWSAAAAKAWSLREWGIGVAAALIPLVCYNRKPGYKSKWFGWFYSIFYPLQFAALLLVRVSN